MGGVQLRWLHLRWLHATTLLLTAPAACNVFIPIDGCCRWSAFGSKRFNTETNTQYVLSCSPVPDLAVLLFSTAFNASLPAQFSSSSGDLEDTGVLMESRPRGRAQLLNGFAGYNFTESDDLAALVWMREHLQLLLELAVSACC
jgi:hypothetical protein